MTKKAIIYNWVIMHVFTAWSLTGESINMSASALFWLTHMGSTLNTEPGLERFYQEAAS